METMSTENKFQFSTQPGAAFVEEIKDNSPDDLIEDVINFQRCVLENKNFSKEYKVNSKFFLTLSMLNVNQESAVELTCYTQALKNIAETGINDPLQVTSLTQFLSGELRACLMLQSANLFGKIFERGKLDENIFKDYNKLQEYSLKVREFFVSSELYKIFLSHVNKFDERVKQIIEKVSDPNF